MATASEIISEQYHNIIKRVFYNSIWSTNVFGI